MSYPNDVRHWAQEMNEYYEEVYKVNELRNALESALKCLEQGEYWCQKPETIIQKCKDALS